MNPATRRAGGMVYTSIENIHKVIAPLFLDDLTRRVDEILEDDFSRKERKERVDGRESGFSRVEGESVENVLDRINKIDRIGDVENPVNPVKKDCQHKAICGDNCGFVDCNCGALGTTRPV